MSMVKPIGAQMPAYDANNAQLFSFTSNGGDQVVKNKLIIRLNTTNETIYENTQTTYSFNQTVPSGTLANGSYYNFSFITYDVNGNASLESSPISFYCYTTPIITFNNISQNQLVTNASYIFNVTYSQVENEKIDFLKFYIYNINDSIIGESDNLYSVNNPPIEFSHEYEGFENNSTYKIKAVATTINNTVVNSDLITFNVSYVNPILFSRLDLENKCNEGYNQIISNMVMTDGEANPSDVDYVNNNTEANITGSLDYIKWEQGYSIEKDFRFELWFGIGNIGKQFKLINKNNSNTYFIGNWVREIPYGEMSVKDYVEVVGYVNEIETFYMRSNYVDIANNTSYIVLWFKFNPNNSVYELILDVSSQVPNTLYWNDDENSNVQYGRLTTLQYEEESYKQGIQKNNTYGNMSSIFPITSVELYNGVYDNINITRNVVKEFTTDKLIWDYCTYLNCDFNGNINGGNVNIILSQLDYVRVKAREVGETSWITLYEVPIQNYSDLMIIKQDYRVPSFSQIEYAVVPVLSGGAEGDYITSVLDVNWNKLFVSDSSGITMSLYNSVSYGDTTSNMDIATLQPINSKYPITIQNGETDYENGSVSGYVLQDNFVNELNRKEIVRLNQEWVKFLKNGKTKIIKDWNGNIWIGRVNSSPTRNYNQSIGNGFGSILFTFVEQGKWDNQEDLYKNNITEIE